MSGTTEALARVKIDKLLEDAGWNPRFASRSRLTRTNR